MLAGYGHLLGAARRLQWDAEQIDLGADRPAHHALDPDRRKLVEAILAGFWVAEHQVAEQLAPFIEAAEPEARELFELQASDERRHARFFDRVLREVVGVEPGGAAPQLAGPALLALFDHELPTMAAALAAGEVELRTAVALYHLVLEAIVLGTGQEALLELAATLPGVSAGVARVQADERWHVGLGVQVLSAARVSPGPELNASAARAAAAWGPDVATPDRVERALAAHRRRTGLLAQHARDASD